MKPRIARSTPPLYVQIAQRMALLIDHRTFKPGQRLPSVRDLAANNGVSISTAVQALHWLEERNLVEARPKSGYFVALSGRSLALPATSRPPKRSVVVERQSRAELFSTLTQLRAQAPELSPRSGESPEARVLPGANKTSNALAIRDSESGTKISGHSPSISAVQEGGVLLNASAQADGVGHGRPVGGIPVIDGSEDVNGTRHVVSFGEACPKDPSFFDEARVRAALNRATREHRSSLVEYRDSPGSPALRVAAAQRALHLGCQLEADNIVVTASCMHAVGLCLRAVTKPGDIVALESPTHFGFLDLLESLNLRALEIPTHPKEGMSLAALQLALDTQPVKAVLTVPTLSNPLGAVMRHQDKKAMVKMLAQRQIPLIEDVILNDLLASDERRKAAKAFDTDGGVMVCGSFSKTVAPGVRLGWVEAGRWRDAVSRLKRTQGVPTNEVLENALADLITQVGYESRLRRLSQCMKERLSQARDLIGLSFPKGTRVSAPPSGYTLWLELPERFDVMALFRACQHEGIIFGPGGLFSATDRFDHCLRLSFAGPWSDTEQRALVRVGELAKKQMGAIVSKPDLQG